jgi:protein-disulfide isomerase-like protein with CxxC motif
VVGKVITPGNGAEKGMDKTGLLHGHGAGWMAAKRGKIYTGWPGLDRITGIKKACHRLQSVILAA